MTVARRVDVLVVSRQPASVGPLLRAVAEADCGADLAADLAEARQLFFEQGGHQLLVLAPDLSPGSARRIVGDLRALDPELGVVAFADRQLGTAPCPRSTRASAFHPASRAGIGAVLKALQRL